DRLVGLMARGVVRVRPDDVDRPDEVAAMLEHFEAAGPAPQPDPEPVPLLAVVDEGEEPGEPADPVELWAAPGADDPPAAAGVESLEVGTGAAAAAVPAAGDPSPESDVALAAPADAVEPAGLVEPLGVEAFGVVEPVGVEAFGAAGLDTVVPFDAPGGFDEGAASAEPLASDEAFGPVESVGLVGAVESVEVVGFAEPVGPLEAAGFAEPVGPLEAAGFAEPVGFADAFGPVEPVGLAEPVGFPDAVAPVAPPPDGVPVAPAVEWSPWAQALGLGAPAPEGELVVDPLAGPGIAEMIAGAHGLNDVEHVLVPPVPMAPEAAAVPEPRFPDVADWAVDAAGLPGHDVAETPVLTADEPAQEPVAEDALQSALLAPLMPGLRGQ
nr:hypothetical protein [Candidatus Nanopelagicales bacterium]